MAQSAARKSHNLNVVSSILTCRTFCHSTTGRRRETRANQKQHKRKLDNSVIPECRINVQGSNNFTDAPQRWQRQWRSWQRVSLIILRSWVRSSLIAFFVTVIHTEGEKPEPTKSSTNDSLTTVLFRNAASTYKAPITSLIHHKGDSANGAVGSA